MRLIVLSKTHAWLVRTRWGPGARTHVLCIRQTMMSSRIRP